MTNPADPFATAATAGPVVRCLGHDRLIVAVPMRVEQQAVPTQFLNGRPVGTMADVLIADVIAIDGAPIMFGGDPTKGIADTEGPIMPGTPMREFRFYQTTLISQLRGHIGQGPVIGRLTMSQTKSGLPNWKLGDPRGNDRQMALAPYQAYASGAFNAPTAPQSAPPAAPVWTAPTAQYAPQPTAQPVQGVPPMVPGVGVPAGMPQPPAQPAYDWTASAAPVSGFDAAQWASFAPHQREQLLALNGVTAPVAVPA